MDTMYLCIASFLFLCLPPEFSRRKTCAALKNPYKIIGILIPYHVGNILYFVDRIEKKLLRLANANIRQIFNKVLSGLLFEKLAKVFRGNSQDAGYVLKGNITAVVFADNVASTSYIIVGFRRT